MFDRSATLSSEELKFYDNNGYLIVDNIFSLEECEQAIFVFERHARLSDNTEFKAVMNLDRPEEWSHIYKPHERWAHQYVRQMLLKHPAIVTILETIQRTEPGGVVLMQSMFLYKKASTDYNTQAWLPHQDGIYHGSPLGGTLTANIIFTDQDKENGCMFVYPGSHKIGCFLEAKQTTSFHEKFGQKPGNDVTDSLPEEFKGKEIELHLKQGSILVLHGGVIHGSYPNISPDRDRPMFLAPYKTEGVPFSVGLNGDRKEIPIR